LLKPKYTIEIDFESFITFDNVAKGDLISNDFFKQIKSDTTKGNNNCY
jgi:hypothetical protein